MRLESIRSDYCSGSPKCWLAACAVWGLMGTEMTGAQVSTIRLRLLKIAARVRVSVRRIYLSMKASYPWGSLFAQVHAHLRAVATPTG